MLSIFIMGTCEKRFRKIRALRARDGDLCAYCGVLLDFRRGVRQEVSTNKATVDHVVPKSVGGFGFLENLKLCCPRCNAKKGSRLLPGKNMDWLRGVCDRAKLIHAIRNRGVDTP